MGASGARQESPLAFLDEMGYIDRTATGADHKGATTWATTSESG